MNELAIKVENLSKIFKLYDDPVDRLKEALHPFRKKYHKDFYALEGINFEIKKNEIVGIIGKNGAGKSTLLKILTGILTPTEGDVCVNGRVLSLLELGTGFNPELTGIENVFFNGALLGASRGEMEQKLDAILEFADIGSFVHQPVKTYSSGMYVRLAFAVIANMDADILIVDEALSVGDAFFVQKCMRFLRNFITDGTLVFVSHDTAAVLNLCTRALWVHEGKLKNDGSPKFVADLYLAELYNSKKGTHQSVAENNENEIEIQSSRKEYRDMRLEFINSTPYRNDIELFSFQTEGVSFGIGGASISSVILLDENNLPLSWVVGGEMVNLVISAVVRDSLFNPIIGFIVKDRLGQCIFADNTFVSSISEQISASPGQTLEAKFCFQMPIMPVGDYSICVAIAEGSQLEHVHHQWINDALIFKVHSSSVFQGLLGIPMLKITMSVK